jgi:outer membrane immunogenic protein
LLSTASSLSPDGFAWACHSRFIAPAPLVPFGSFSNDEHTIKAGLNYHFNWASPMVARY